MTINYTSLLGLAQPVTGTEANTWGTVVNDEITALVEEAIAGGESISVTAGNVTLTDTDGVSNQARNAILIITGTPGTTRNVIAPSTSKTYIVINNSDSSVVIKGAATTGVTITATDKALVAWNGSDFVRVGASAGGSNTQVQYNNNGNLAGSANLTFDGTTLTAAGFADSSLTSGRVTYATTGGNLTDSANLTFDGSNLTVGAQGDVRFADSDSSNWVAFQGAATIASNVTWTLPNADGSNGQFLSTNGSGTLSWATSTGFTADNGIFVNANTVSTSYTIASGYNGLSAGPVTVNSGVTVTISSGSVWTVV